MMGVLHHQRARLPAPVIRLHLEGRAVRDRLVEGHLLLGHDGRHRGGLVRAVDLGLDLGALGASFRSHWIITKKRPINETSY
jgi:hypothetical protein